MHDTPEMMVDGVARSRLMCFMEALQERAMSIGLHSTYAGEQTSGDEIIMPASKQWN